jgi:hypothetical protein
MISSRFTLNEKHHDFIAILWEMKNQAVAFLNISCGYNAAINTYMSKAQISIPIDAMFRTSLLATNTSKKIG